VETKGKKYSRSSRREVGKLQKKRGEKNGRGGGIMTSVRAKAPRKERSLWSCKGGKIKLREGRSAVGNEPSGGKGDYLTEQVTQMVYRGVKGFPQRRLTREKKKSHRSPPATTGHSARFLKTTRGREKKREAQGGCGGQSVCTQVGKRRIV